MKISTTTVVIIALVTATAPAIAGLGGMASDSPGEESIELPTLDEEALDLEEVAAAMAERGQDALLEEAAAAAEGEDLPEDCTPHPPILIQQDVGPLGFEWENPATGETEYRPGSGVVAGSGTSEDPYVIEGWCIVGEPNAREIAHVEMTGSTADGSESGSGLALDGTSAHVVIQDNAILGASTADTAKPFLMGLNQVGIHLDGANNVAVEKNDIAGFARGVILQDSDDTVALRGNTITDNTFQDVVLDQSSSVTLAENQLGSHGIDFDRLEGRGSGGSSPPNLNYFLHDIDASNTVNGEPVRYVSDASEETITGEAGQVIIVASTDVLVDGVDIPHNATTLVAFSEDVVIRNSNLTEPLNILVSPGSVVEENDLSVLLVKPRSHGTTVRENLFADPLDPRAPFVHIAADKNVVQGNTITGAGDDGLEFDGSQNTIIGNSIAQSQAHGMNVGGSGNNVIDGNTISGSDRLGMRLSAPENSIKNNTITENGHRGIRITSSADSQDIERNTISRNGRTGVYVGISSHHVIRDNTILENGGHGLESSIGFSGGHSSSAIYEGNTIAHNERAGIFLYGGGDHTVLENVVHDNGLSGVHIQASHNVVRQNTIRDNGLSGVRIQDSDDNVVRQNTIRDNGRDGLRLHSPGTVEGLTGVLTDDAWSQHNPDLHTGAGSNLHTVEYNNITGNERHGISVDYSFGDRINHNNIQDNGQHGVYANDTKLVHALHNWWGCEEGPVWSTCDSVEGPVYYHEWLTEPLPGAGAREV